MMHLEWRGNGLYLTKYYIVCFIQLSSLIQICEHLKNPSNTTSQLPAISVVSEKSIKKIFQVKNNLKSHSSACYSCIAILHKREKVHTKHTMGKYATSGRNVLLHLFFVEQNICVSIQTIIIPVPPPEQKRKQTLQFGCFLILGNM